jgi:hypothetical protein
MQGTHIHSNIIITNLIHTNVHKVLISIPVFSIAIQQQIVNLSISLHGLKRQGARHLHAPLSKQVLPTTDEPAPSTSPVWIKR